MAKRKTISGGEVYFVENGNFEGEIWRRSKGAHLISIIFFDAFLLIAVVFLLPQEHQVVHLRHQQQHIIELAAVTDTAIAKKGPNTATTIQSRRRHRVLILWSFLFQRVSNPIFTFAAFLAILRLI